VQLKTELKDDELDNIFKHVPDAIYYFIFLHFVAFFFLSPSFIGCCLICRALDKDGDGTVSFSEWVRVLFPDSNSD
jgi:uncharacterized membrane protein